MSTIRVGNLPQDRPGPAQPTGFTDVGELSVQYLLVPAWRDKCFHPSGRLAEPGPRAFEGQDSHPARDETIIDSAAGQIFNKHLYTRIVTKEKNSSILLGNMTKQRYHVARCSFIDLLVERHLLDTDPGVEDALKGLSGALSGGAEDPVDHRAVFE